MGALHFPVARKLASNKAREEWGSHLYFVTMWALAVGRHGYARRVLKPRDIQTAAS